MKRGTRRYFFAFMPLAALVAVPLAFMFSIGFWGTFGFPTSLLYGAISAGVYSAGLTWLMAWLASRRRLLARPQDVRGLHVRRYLDLAGAQAAVFSGCADILRLVCEAGTIVQDPQQGVLSGETRPSLSSWGSEISLWVEPLGEAHTRVQLLSRPVLPINVVDFGANQRKLNQVVGMLRTRFTVVAEG